MNSRKRKQLASIAQNLLIMEGIDIENEAQRPKKLWVRPWLTEGEFGQNASLVFDEIKDIDEKEFTRTFRMNKEEFSYVLEKIRSDIEKEDTAFRQAITAEKRLMIALLYLATGTSYQVLSKLFRVAASSICQIIPKVCDSIWNNMSAEEIPLPKTPEDWKKIAKDFEINWNYPFCLGK